MIDMRELQKHLGIIPKAVKPSSEVEPTKPQNQTPLQITDPSDIVFISIDIEAYEHAHHKITEIGISTFDTRSLTNSSKTPITPGPNACDWLPLIQHRHIRIKEHLKLVNKRYIKGCPEKFDFGTSDIQNLHKASNIVQRILQTGSLDPDMLPSTASRQVVILSHGLSNDIKFLTQIGLPPTSPLLVNAKKADTQVLCRSSKRFTISLAKLLTVLGIEYKNLHNAGNDAAFTAQALLIMAVVEAETPDEVRRRVRVLSGSQEPSAEERKKLKWEKIERKRKRREERLAMRAEAEKNEGDVAGEVAGLKDW